MGRRPARRARGSLAWALALVLVLLPATTGGRAVERVEAPAADVSALEGSGWAAKALCMSCAAAIIGISGGSVGGFVLLGALYPEMYGACAYQCYYAFS